MTRFYRPPQGKYSDTKSADGQAILDIRHFSGALPMWTGIRISSPQKKLPLINY